MLDVMRGDLRGASLAKGRRETSRLRLPSSIGEAMQTLLDRGRIRGRQHDDLPR